MLKKYSSTLLYEKRKNVNRKDIWPPQDQVFWYLNRPSIKPCYGTLETEIVVIGGGMAGLSAAQACAKRGKRVVLLEQYYCGSGASGKSSGFITPNAELSLTDFTHIYGLEAAHSIWDLFVTGVEDIRSNILTHQFSCDYAPQNTLVVANSKKDLKQLLIEHNNLEKLGYKNTFFNAQTIKGEIGSDTYFGGVRYEDTFGINAYHYCQELKHHLQDSGVLIFEETPVTKIDEHTVHTLHARIRAEQIIVCTDRFIPDLGLLKNKVYHAQTFLMISQQLPQEQIRSLFPAQNLMVWDTDLIYTYFRMTGDNRLLLGGGSFLSTYSSQEYHNYAPMIKKLTTYMRKAFPQVTIQFEHEWPGLIGITPDVVPIAGPDRDRPFIYYVTGCSGLPIATALGRYSVEHLLDGRKDLDQYFSPYRTFPLPQFISSLLGAKLSCALSNTLKRLL